MAKRRPNIVDILIVCVIAVLCAAAVFKFTVVNQKESAGVGDAAAQMTYTARIQQVRMATINALHEGDKVFDDKTGLYVGTIKGITHEVHTKNVLQQDGTVKVVDFPDYYNVFLTLEGPVIEKEEGYFVDGLVELKANSDFKIQTKYAQTTMRILTIGQ